MHFKSYSESYKEAGVDITAGYSAVELMKEHIARTQTPGVLTGIGGFGGLFAPDMRGIEEPVLVSGTDGVGTKLKIAFRLDKHDTVGIDCVAMCVNDIICCGATPLFFLDYIASGKNIPAMMAKVVAGVAEGCVQAGCALIGGETAEMPDFYPVGEYDLAGFAVGLVDRKKILDKERVRVGDQLIALPSSGLHSNGFSLVRKVFDTESSPLHRYSEELGATLGDVLITPTKIYVKPLLSLVDKLEVHAVANITGGGIYENIARALPPHCTASLEKSRIRTQPIFKLLQAVGGIPEHDMYNTFNMGVGMVVIVDGRDVDRALSILREQGEDAYLIGEVVAGEDGVRLW